MLSDICMQGCDRSFDFAENYEQLFFLFIFLIMNKC